MVFSSIQAYLDPANWQQQPPQNYPAGATSGASSHLFPHPPPPLPPPPPPPQAQPPHGSNGGSIRPGSMADRARLANVPMPEAALKCPRCESTNTKFCYFNNYSLSQPRHFCKTCRRYWTRGGALRNVPVGGGCRRNKRSKSNSSNSNSSTTSATSSKSQENTPSMAVGPSSTINALLSPNYTSHGNLLGQMISPMRFMAPLHQLNEFTSSDTMGMNNYNMISAMNHELSTFQIGNALASGSGSGSGSGGGTLLTGLDQWRSHPPQLPLLGGNLDSSNSSGLYSFEGGAEQLAGYVGQVRPKIGLSSSSALAAQLASVKMEESSHKWGNAGTSTSSWTDLSSFSSSSAGNPL